MSKDNTVININHEGTNPEGNIINKSLTIMGQELQKKAENLHLLFQTLNINTENVSGTITLADNNTATGVISLLQNGTMNLYQVCTQLIIVKKLILSSPLFVVV